MEKGCYWWNRLSSILILAIFVLLVGCMEAEELPQGVLIEGVTIENGVATALKGYEFVTVKGDDEDGESIALRNIKTGISIFDDFDCGCDGTGDPGAGCKKHETPDSMSCTETVCKSCGIVMKASSLKLSVVLKAGLGLPCKRPSKTV